VRRKIDELAEGSESEVGKQQEVDGPVFLKFCQDHWRCAKQISHALKDAENTTCDSSSHTEDHNLSVSQLYRCRVLELVEFFLYHR